MNLDVDSRLRTSSVDMNLFTPLHRDTEKEFALGQGNELGTPDQPGKLASLISSAGLAVNVFDAWRGLSAAPLCQAICDGFDALVPGLYDEADRAVGGIEVPDRRGVPQRYPLLSLSIGVATTDRRDFEHQGEVVAVATEMKRYAKARGEPGRSRWAVDRREDDGEAVDLEVDLP